MAGDAVTVAIVQRPPVLLDRDATLQARRRPPPRGRRCRRQARRVPRGVRARATRRGSGACAPGPTTAGPPSSTPHLLAASVDLVAGDLQPLQDAAAERQVTVVVRHPRAGGRVQPGHALQHAGDDRARRRRSSTGTASSCPPTPSGWCGGWATPAACGWSTRPPVGSAASSAGRTTCRWRATPSTPRASRCTWRRRGTRATPGSPACATSPPRAGAGCSAPAARCRSTTCRRTSPARTSSGPTAGGSTPATR